MEKSADIEGVESQLWDELVEKFDDEERHKKYLRYCLEKNLVGKAIKRYGEYAQTKDEYSVEMRRAANAKREQLTSVLMIGSKIRSEDEKKAKLSTLDIFALVLNLLLFFAALFLESWGMFFAFLLTFGVYIAYKYMESLKKKGAGGG